MPNIIKTTHCLAAMSIKDHLIKLTMWWQGAQKLRYDRPGGAAAPPPPVSFATDDLSNDRRYLWLCMQGNTSQTVLPLTRCQYSIHDQNSRVTFCASKRKWEPQTSQDIIKEKQKASINEIRFKQWWRNFFQSGGSQVHVKKYGKFLLLQLTTVRSQALKYDVTNFCQHV